jgi:adenine-specific DNA-methyltransferase
MAKKSPKSKTANTAVESPSSEDGILSVETIKHVADKRKNIPTAEHQSVVDDKDQSPIKVAYERRNRDLDPQLVWRGKDMEDWSDLVVNAPPLYIQEKVHPKALIDELMREQSLSKKPLSETKQKSLFDDFNGVPEGADKTDFYQHDQNWTNRMILGDSLQVMASLAEREGLRGKVQCIYFDPPYGIKFNSNFQWSTTSRDVKDGKPDHITREPEQVKAFRDTWRDGIHSYLTYLRDRLTVARDLLTESGSIFIQIGDDNVHRVRSVLDEVFGDKNFIETISYRTKNMTLGGRFLEGVCDTILWYGKNAEALKYRRLFGETDTQGDSHWNQVMFKDGTYRKLTSAEINDRKLHPSDARIYQLAALYPTGSFATGVYTFEFRGKQFDPPPGRSWKSPVHGMKRLVAADRIEPYSGGSTIRYRLLLDDYPVSPLHNVWLDTAPPSDKQYVVQTGAKAIQRCILMATDPGDLVLDPTCGSGTTATVAEQWGRRWITIDTSRVALALARSRIMGARYPFYLLADSREGYLKEAEISRSTPSDRPTYGNIRQGFIYERVPHITLKSIANNAEIDVIWEKWQTHLEPLRDKLNKALKKTWQEWEMPRDSDPKWSEAVSKTHAEWWEARINRQREIDASIAAKADFEYLYDKPYIDKKKVRVAGPFTVESLSPHRTLALDENDNLVDPQSGMTAARAENQSFDQMIIQNLKSAGVQQAAKSDKILFSTINPWPGQLISAEGWYLEGKSERRAAIFIGPEFGTVQRADLVAAAREAGDSGFDVLIACAFNYEAHTTEFNKLGRIPVLKARMNADLHMSDELKNTGKGNLFVVFGEPDIELVPEKNGNIKIKVKGVDVFKPQTGEVESGGTDKIACWMLDTNYNEESFFVRHAYFLGANDPYKSLKQSLKAEIDAEAWESLNSDTSRPFEKPKSGRIAVKVINHLGDEVMKVFKVT